MQNTFIVSWKESGQRSFIKFFSLVTAKELYEQLKKEKKRCEIKELYLSKVIK